MGGGMVGRYNFVDRNDKRIYYDDKQNYQFSDGKPYKGLNINVSIISSCMHSPQYIYI